MSATPAYPRIQAAPSVDRFTIAQARTDIATVGGKKPLVFSSYANKDAPKTASIMLDAGGAPPYTLYVKPSVQMTAAMPGSDLSSEYIPLTFAAVGASYELDIDAVDVLASTTGATYVVAFT